MPDQMVLLRRCIGLKFPHFNITAAMVGKELQLNVSCLSRRNIKTLISHWDLLFLTPVVVQCELANVYKSLFR